MRVHPMAFLRLICTDDDLQNTPATALEWKSPAGGLMDYYGYGKLHTTTRTQIDTVLADGEDAHPSVLRFPTSGT
jgi:hypothetical protein